MAVDTPFHEAPRDCEYTVLKKAKNNRNIEVLFTIVPARQHQAVLEMPQRRDPGAALCCMHAAPGTLGIALVGACVRDFCLTVDFEWHAAGRGDVLSLSVSVSVYVCVSPSLSLSLSRSRARSRSMT